MLRALAVTAAVGLLVAPTASQATPPGPTAAKIVTALRAKGLPMTPKGKLRQPFFEPPARLYANPEGGVQMWQFRDERRARAAAAGVSGDGSTVRSGSKIRLMEWLAPPHWFRGKSVVVLYLGSDGPTLSALRNVLGAQFAGRKGASAAQHPTKMLVR